MESKKGRKAETKTRSAKRREVTPAMMDAGAEILSDLFDQNPIVGRKIAKDIYEVMANKA